jgi:hypothetical protein
VAIQNYSAVAAACLITRRAILEQVCGIDADHFPFAYFDVDLCLRIGRAGYRTLWTPHAELRWLDPASWPVARGPDGSRHVAKARRLMRRRWDDVLPCDPSYNPNLSERPEHGGLASPPRRPAQRLGDDEPRERPRIVSAVGAMRPPL